MRQAPEILKVKPFSELREQFIKGVFIPYATSQVGGEMAQQLAAGLESPNECAALLLDCMILYRQQETRNDNYLALQQFSQTATDSDMIDLIVGRFQIERQVIEPADNSVFPPKAAVMESDESLLLRYSLAPFALATTGTRLGYRYHALTIGTEPLKSVEVESSNVVVMRYEFVNDDGVERPKDADARMLTPQSGEVSVRILSFQGDGQASQSLCDAVFNYLSRDDIGQESDTLTVDSAEIVTFEIDIEVMETPEPNKLVDRTALTNDLWDYVKKQHKLGGRIQHSKLDQIAHNHNADEIVIKKPVESDLKCEWYQAPFCTGVNSIVKPKQTT